MKYSPFFFNAPRVCGVRRPSRGQQARHRMRIGRFALVLGLLAVAACLPLAPRAFGQIQSTISCPSGHGYWDVLSVMMMDPGLASSYHMEGYHQRPAVGIRLYPVGSKSDQGVLREESARQSLGHQSLRLKLHLPMGHGTGRLEWRQPLERSNQLQEIQQRQSEQPSDFSMRWAARCAAPGGANSSFWNPPPPTQPNNTNYYTYVDQD